MLGFWNLQLVQQAGQQPGRTQVQRKATTPLTRLLPEHQYQRVGPISLTVRGQESVMQVPQLYEEVYHR